METYMTCDSFDYCKKITFFWGCIHVDHANNIQGSNLASFIRACLFYLLLWTFQIKRQTNFEKLEIQFLEEMN
jgi:hypothetical protein